MKQPNWACWIWYDRDVIKYVGSGPFTDERGHPAIRMWKGRFGDNSDLGKWLQEFIDEPRREVCGATILPKKLARDLAAIYRSRHKMTVLSSREHDGGGYCRKIAYLPTDDFSGARVYESVREAGREHGVNPATISRRCQNPNKPEWIYV